MNRKHGAARVTYSLGDVSEANTHVPLALAHVAEALGVLEDRELVEASLVAALRELGRVRAALAANHEHADGFNALRVVDAGDLDEAEEGAAA